jgi:hypothetical protein
MNKYRKLSFSLFFPLFLNVYVLAKICQAELWHVFLDQCFFALFICSANCISLGKSEAPVLLEVLMDISLFFSAFFKRLRVRENMLGRTLACFASSIIFCYFFVGLICISLGKSETPVLLEVLMDKVLSRRFFEFLQAEASAENYLFWHSVERFREIENVEGTS